MTIKLERGLGLSDRTTKKGTFLRLPLVTTQYKHIPQESRRRDGVPQRHGHVALKKNNILKIKFFFFKY